MVRGKFITDKGEDISKAWLILCHLQAIENIILEDKTHYRQEAKVIHNRMKRDLHLKMRLMESALTEEQIDEMDNHVYRYHLADVIYVNEPTGINQLEMLEKEFERISNRSKEKNAGASRYASETT